MTSVGCTPPSEAAEQVRIQQFSDAETLRDFWDAQLDEPALALALEENDDACRDGEPGTRKWGFGNLACLVTDDGAQVRWTDQRTQTYGVATAPDDDVAALFEWWRTTARPLGRAIDDEPDDTEEPSSRKQRPLVRVPGAPRAISCDATSDPIPDEWGRRWELKNVEFLDRPRYDRVILNLVRIGRNRSDRPTQAVVERMTRAQVPDRVPGASRPRRGRTAIVVRLDGVPRAPNIQRFRPNATALVRELSIVRTNGSRAVVISSPRGTCYQMRIPVWGPSASGKERRAEIFIDLSPNPNG